MARAIAFLFAVLVWLPVQAATDIDFGRFHALLIGVNDYQYLPKLETAINDASAVADVLRQFYGFEVTLLLNPTRGNIIRTLDKLRASLTERDNLLIYYAGHGVLDAEADEGFWQPVDAEPDTQSNWIAISTVTRSTKAISAKHVMVIADSCYSGALVRSAPAQLATSTDRLAELRRLSSKRSRTALVSGGLEPVYDGGGDGHSVFTRALLTTLRESDEILDGQGLFMAVRRPVVVNAEQTPQYSDIRLSGHEGGDLLFVPLSLGGYLGAEDTAPRSGFDVREIELAYWESVKESQDPASIESYIEQYPEGAFAALARRRLDILKKGPAPTGPILTEFDGEWRGRAKKKAGHSECPRVLRWTASISGESATGEGSRETFDFSATIDAGGRLEGTAAMWAGNVSLEGQHEDGEFTGQIIHRAGCTWEFELTRAD